MPPALPRSPLRLLPPPPSPSLVVSAACRRRRLRLRRVASQAAEESLRVGTAEIKILRTSNRQLNGAYAELKREVDGIVRERDELRA